MQKLNVVVPVAAFRIWPENIAAFAGADPGVGVVGVDKVKVAEHGVAVLNVVAFLGSTVDEVVHKVVAVAAGAGWQELVKEQSNLAGTVGAVDVALIAVEVDLEDAGRITPASPLASTWARAVASSLSSA